LFFDFKNEDVESFYALDMESGKPYRIIHHLEDENDSDSEEQYSFKELSYQELAAGAWVCTIDGYEEIKEMNENNWREYLGWQR